MTQRIVKTVFGGKMSDRVLAIIYREMAERLDRAGLCDQEFSVATVTEQRGVTGFYATGWTR